MKKIVYQGQYMSVSEETIQDHVFERIHLRPGVHVFPFHDGKILLIKEYRHHEGASRWKFIGGWMDKDDKSSLEIAQEELLEEVSMVADRWDKIYEIAPSDTTIDNPVSFWVAHDPVITERLYENPDMFIIEDTKWVDQVAFQEMIDTHELRWSEVALAGLQVLRQYTK